MKFQISNQAAFSVVFFLALLMLISPTVHAAAGDVDPSFNAGVITSQFAQDRLSAVAVSPDGKIIVGGSSG